MREQCHKQVDELTKNEGEKEENQRNIIDNMAKLTEIKTNLSAYLAKRDTMDENIKQDKVKLAELEQQNQNLKLLPKQQLKLQKMFQCMLQL